MNKKNTISILGLLITLSLNAQDKTDALRYSQITFGGTARYNSMAGAFGALGADMSVLSTNPAGLGLYKKTEISFSPNSFYQSTNSDYMSTGGTGSNSQSGSKYMNGIQNIGIASAWDLNTRGNESGWQTFNFGLVYNQLANFNSNTNSQGYNYTNNSLPAVFVKNANGTQPTNLNANAEALAFDAFLIDNRQGVTQGGTNYVSYLPSGGVFQQNSITSKGNLGETALSFAGNYNNKIYLGGTIGFDFINYSSNTIYTETAIKDSVGGVNSFNMNQQLTTTGFGVNIKLGLIYRVNNWMRLGIAAHSPTQFNMHDNYSTSLTTYFKDSTDIGKSSGYYNYSLTTPARIIASAGFIFAKKGLLGIDYEYLDYSTANLSSSDAGVFSSTNYAIQNKYTKASNIRIGAEWRMIENLALRVGYAYYGNPYQSGANINASRNNYTAGLGFRERNFYIDLAYVLMQYKENSYFYDPTIVNVNPVKNTSNITKVILTCGLKF